LVLEESFPRIIAVVCCIFVQHMRPLIAANMHFSTTEFVLDAGKGLVTAIRANGEYAPWI
jgi:hypothetical protein